MHFINTLDEFKTRYDLAKFMEYTNNCYDVLTSYVLENISALEISETNVVQTEEQRPDLISYNIYGTTQYWWILMHFNAFINIDNFINSVNYNIFSITDLEDMYFSLKSLERLNSLDTIVEDTVDTMTIVHIAGTIITKEIPTGLIDGINQAYLLQFTPISDTDEVYLNGILQQGEGNDYTLSGRTIIFTSAPFVDSKILISYITT